MRFIEKISSVLPLILASTIGFISFLIYFGFSALDTANIDWLIRDDHAQSLMGWLYFSNSPWLFPLGTIPNYTYPIGSTIGFNDTFPWFAIGAKFVSSILPIGKQIHGLWMLTNFVLQGVFSFLLLKSLGVRRPMAMIGVLFFVTSPILIFRFDIGHASLCAHWCVIAALWLAVKHHGRDAPLVLWLTLLTFSWTTHPYIGAMVFAIAVAHCGHSVRTLLIRGSILMTASIVLLYTLGFFSSSGSNSEGGFHHFSSDILGFFNPRDRSSLIPGREKAGQYEGLAWLGTGGVFLLLLSLWDAQKSGRGVLSFLYKPQHKTLVLICLAMALFSLGSRVRIWGSWIASLESLYQHLDFVTGPFRSAGRFIWPLYYLVFAFVILQIQEFKARKLSGSVLLLIGFGLQLIDQFPFLQSDARMLSRKGLSELTSQKWTQMDGVFKHIALVPPHYEPSECLAKATNYPTTYYAPFAIKAWEQNMTINSGPRARPPVDTQKAYCTKFLLELRNGLFKDDVVYIVHPTLTDLFAGQNADKTYCESIDGHLVCVSKSRQKQLVGG
jgi:hypothetical protein